MFVLLVALWAQGPTPLAQQRSADSLLDEALFEEAIAAANGEIKRGGLSTPELARRHLLLGQCFAALDQPERATEAFGRALALESSLDLPAQASPKVLEPFVVARRRHAGVAIRLEASTRRAAPGRIPAISARVAGDRLGLASQLRVTSRHASGAWRELSLALPATGAGFELAGGEPPGAVEYFLEALDGDGNRVAALGTRAKPLVVFPEPALAARGDPLRGPADVPFYQRGWFWPSVAGSVALLAGGTVLFARSRTDETKVPFRFQPDVR